MQERRTRPIVDAGLQPPEQWERIEHHTRTLDRAIHMTEMADAKVAPVLALHVSLAAVTVTQSTGLGELLRASGYTVPQAVAGWLLLVVYAVASLIATFYVAVVYVPTAPRRRTKRTHTNSLFYFDDIQAMPVGEFEQRSIEIDLDLLERDVIHQAHAVSKIATGKLRGVQRAYFYSALTLLAWMPLTVIERM